MVFSNFKTVIIDFYDFISPFSHYFCFDKENIYLAVKTVFDRISKQLKFLEKHSAARRVFSTLFSVFELG